MRRALIWLACLVVGALTAEAQVTARSGAPPAEPAKTFRSPMILEVRVPGVAAVASEETRGRRVQVGLAELQGYTCDEVTLVSATGQASRTSLGGGAVLDLQLVLRAAIGIDKLAHLRATLFVQGIAVGTASARRIDAEEGKKVKATLAVPFAWNTMPPGTIPTLQLTVTVEDNP